MCVSTGATSPSWLTPGPRATRFPILRDWSTADLQMLAGLFVDTMIATIDAILEATGSGSGSEGLSSEAEARIVFRAEKQLRLIGLAIPHWRSSS